ncbi:uncharacterized protein BDW70DRAFT_155604 [Aspergillus foveolatus]|uniref:uncharacterized protein n=1 Tax=Aspergillus foveolatus TaxID=210207 RepID=UPI003CCE1CED
MRNDSLFDNSSLASDDSVSKKRRHAMYFHRPPVWRYSSFQDGSLSPEMSEDLNNSDRDIDEDLWMGSLRLVDHQKTDAAPYVILEDSDSDKEIPLLEPTLPDESTFLECRPSETRTDPFHQKKPIFCTRLQSYKDIRLGLGEQWAIQEGSLVIGINPEYTIFVSPQRRMDEFDIAEGNLYVVCSLYADLWALCAEVSFGPSSSGDNLLRLAFLPLCAITLAPNYSAFVQRSTQSIQYFGSREEKYPGNGLAVIPPRRSHSLTASKQIFQGLDGPMTWSDVVRGALQVLTPRQTDEDFVPLDSTLEPIFSPLTGKRRLLRRIGSGRSTSRSQDGGNQQTKRKYDYDLNSSLASLCDKIYSKSEGWRRLRRRRISSPRASRKLKLLLKV